MKNDAENEHQKLVPNPFLISVNNPKYPLHARNLFTIKYFERNFQKALKNINFTFSFKRSPFNWQGYARQKGPETRKQVQKNSFIRWCLTWPSFMM